MIARIRMYPDEMLRAVCKPLAIHEASVRQQVRTLLTTMLETMHEAKGWGLAAPQIGVPAQLCVVHVPTETASPIVIINPTIMECSTERVVLNEGCLSFHGLREPIERPRTVTLQRYTEDGVRGIETFDGWTARAILHEVEHLQGTLMIDHMGPAARRMIDRSWRRKAAKRAAKHPASVQPTTPALA